MTTNTVNAVNTVEIILDRNSIKFLSLDDIAFISDNPINEVDALLTDFELGRRDNLKLKLELEANKAPKADKADKVSTKYQESIAYIIGSLIADYKPILNSQKIANFYKEDSDKERIEKVYSISPNSYSSSYSQTLGIISNFYRGLEELGYSITLKDETPEKIVEYFEYKIIDYDISYKVAK